MSDYWLGILIVAAGFAYLSLIVGHRDQARLSGALNLIALTLWFMAGLSIVISNSVLAR